MSYIPGLTPIAIAERQTWQYKTLAFTHGNKSQLGAVLLAICGRFVKGPAFHPRGAKITKDGRVLALYRPSASVAWRIECPYERVADFVNAFRGLAAECKLSDAETLAMFEEVRKWIFKDDRAVSVLD